MSLNTEELRSIGIKMGHIKKIQAALRALENPTALISAPPPGPPPSGPPASTSDCGTGVSFLSPATKRAVSPALQLQTQQLLSSIPGNTSNGESEDTSVSATACAEATFLSPATKRAVSPDLQMQTQQLLKLIEGSGCSNGGKPTDEGSDDGISEIQALPHPKDSDTVDLKEDEGSDNEISEIQSVHRPKEGDTGDLKDDEGSAEEVQANASPPKLSETVGIRNRHPSQPGNHKEEDDEMPDHDIGGKSCAGVLESTDQGSKLQLDKIKNNSSTNTNKAGREKPRRTSIIAKAPTLPQQNAGCAIWVKALLALTLLISGRCAFEVETSFQPLQPKLQTPSHKL
jgi:hypothetical protein